MRYHTALLSTHNAAVLFKVPFVPYEVLIVCVLLRPQLLQSRPCVNVVLGALFVLRSVFPNSYRVRLAVCRRDAGFGFIMAIPRLPPSV